MTEKKRGGTRPPRPDQPAGGAGPSGRGPRIAGGILIAVLLVVGALWTFAPAQVRSLFGFGTSRPRTCSSRRPSPTASRPRCRAAASVDTAQLSTGKAAGGAAEGARPDPEDQLRLDQMEARLRALADQPGGMTREELQAMLDQNAAQLRAEITRQLLAERPVTAGVDPMGAAAEAEARKRMEEERKRREAIKQAQIASNGVVIDG